MSFEDLPDDWPTMPLNDPGHIADILDLFVSLSARMNGALLILVCDDHRRPVQPIQIDGIQRLRPADAGDVFSQMALTIAEASPGATAMFALARRGGLSVTAIDQDWRRCLEESFLEYMPVIGCHVVTPNGSRIVHAMGAAA